MVQIMMYIGFLNYLISDLRFIIFNYIIYIYFIRIKLYFEFKAEDNLATTQSKKGFYFLIVQVSYKHHEHLYQDNNF